MVEFKVADFLFFGSIPIIVPLVQVLKAFIKDSRYYPILAIIIGIGLNMAIAAYSGTDLFPALLMGVIAGMAAAGIYSTVAPTLKDNGGTNDAVAKTNGPAPSTPTSTP
jgi:hypothetical protein